MILTEEQRGTAAFDLEKARAMICHYRIENPGDADTDCGLEDLIRQANLAEEALDEIERLRASLIDLHAEYINTLEKNPECSAWDLDEQSDADQKRLRRNAAHAISIVEPPIYLQAEQRATKIKELEDAHKRSGAKYAKIINELRSSVYANMPGLKKQWDEILNTPAEAIRQLDVKPRSWKITDERGEALHVMGNMKTLIVCPHCKTPIEFVDIPKYTAVLRAMLTEAEQ